MSHPNRSFVYKESDHFVGKDLEVKKVYKRLIDELLKFGFLRIEPKKANIYLINHKEFAVVYVRSSYINLELYLDYPLQSERVVKIERTSPSRFHHTIHLLEEVDVDAQLVKWLRQAYDLKG